MTNDPRVLLASVNLRELGGLATHDGQQVRTGHLFRSGQLADLTPEDRFTLEDLCLRTIVDLRRPAEVATRPTPALEGVETVSLSVSNDDNEFFVAANAMMDPTAKPLTAEQISEYFRRLASDRFDRYRPVLQLATDPERHPLLFHCTAGKDRTGVVAAILLRLLGVAYDQILEDYLLSNTARRPWIEANEANHRRLIAQNLRIDETDLPAERLAASQALLWCRPSYLTALFEGIDDRWGSWTTFVQNGLDLDDDQLNAFRSALLG